MFRRLLSAWIIVSFLSNLIIPIQSVHADDFLGLPAPGTMVNLSPAYVPVLIKGLKIHPENPLLFDFIIDTGRSGYTSNSPKLRQESEKLIKYFLATLTVPENDLWVNLSPYEKKRIIPEQLGKTELGREMLAQDYILKQLTATLIYPEKGLGKEFWDRVYTKSEQVYGTNQVPVNTFNKVWILPDKAGVFVRNNTAYVVEAHLKVMLEEDYLALQKHSVVSTGTHSIGSQIVRAIILPEIEKEVNQGQNFAPLRQAFYSIILASWYKKNLKEALLNQVYSNKNKINGVENQDTAIKEKIYQQYLKAYKKGVFNYIKEDVDRLSNQPVPRKYFSGGEIFAFSPAMRVDPDPVVQEGLIPDGAMVIVQAAMDGIRSLPRALLKRGRNLLRTVRSGIHPIRFPTAMMTAQTKTPGILEYGESDRIPISADFLTSGRKIDLIMAGGAKYELRVDKESLSVYIGSRLQGTENKNGGILKIKSRGIKGSRVQIQYTDDGVLLMNLDIRNRKLYYPVIVAPGKSTDITLGKWGEPTQVVQVQYLDKKSASIKLHELILWTQENGFLRYGQYEPGATPERIQGILQQKGIPIKITHSNHSDVVTFYNVSLDGTDITLNMLTQVAFLHDQIVPITVPFPGGVGTKPSVTPAMTATAASSAAKARKPKPSPQEKLKAIERLLSDKGISLLDQGFPYQWFIGFYRIDNGQNTVDLPIEGMEFFRQELKELKIVKGTRVVRDRDGRAYGVNCQIGPGIDRDPVQVRTVYMKKIEEITIWLKGQEDTIKKQIAAAPAMTAIAAGEAVSSFPNEFHLMTEKDQIERYLLVTLFGLDLKDAHFFRYSASDGRNIISSSKIAQANLGDFEVQKVVVSKVIDNLNKLDQDVMVRFDVSVRDYTLFIRCTRVKNPVLLRGIDIKKAAKSSAMTVDFMADLSVKIQHWHFDLDNTDKLVDQLVDVLYDHFKSSMPSTSKEKLKIIIESMHSKGVISARWIHSRLFSFNISQNFEENNTLRVRGYQVIDLLELNDGRLQIPIKSGNPQQFFDFFHSFLGAVEFRFHVLQALSARGRDVISTAMRADVYVGPQDAKDHLPIMRYIWPKGYKIFEWTLTPMDRPGAYILGIRFRDHARDPVYLVTLRNMSDQDLFFIPDLDNRDVFNVLDRLLRGPDSVNQMSEYLRKLINNKPKANLSGPKSVLAKPNQKFLLSTERDTFLFELTPGRELLIYQEPSHERRRSLRMGYATHLYSMGPIGVQYSNEGVITMKPYSLMANFQLTLQAGGEIQTVAPAMISRFWSRQAILAYGLLLSLGIFGGIVKRYVDRPKEPSSISANLEGRELQLYDALIPRVITPGVLMTIDKSDDGTIYSIRVNDDSGYKLGTDLGSNVEVFRKLLKDNELQFEFGDFDELINALGGLKKDDFKPELGGVIVRITVPNETEPHKAPPKARPAPSIGPLQIASNRSPGGIDFNANNLHIGSSGDKIDIHFDKAMIARFEKGDFTGVHAQIISITPLSSVFPLFGMKEPEAQEKLAGT